MKKKKYECVWKDDFDNSLELDQSKWEFSVGGSGWGNGELQYYTKNRKENVSIRESQLVIRSMYEEYGHNSFTSAKIISKQAWKYGKIKVKAKLPLAKGTWPAIWMLPVSYDGTNWPNCGEIDICEHFGHTVGEFLFSLHSYDYNFYKNNKFHSSVVLKDIVNEFNIFEIEWDENAILFKINNETHYKAYKCEYKNKSRKEWPFDVEFKLIINLAVGGNEAGRYGIDIEKWPQEFVIDYVHVYQKI